MIRPVPAALALALAVALPFAPALAASDDARRGTERQALAAATWDAAAAAAEARAADKGVVREVEWKRGGWNVKVVNAEGRQVLLRVDAATGAVTPGSR